MTLKGLYIDDVDPSTTAALLTSDKIEFSVQKILKISEMTNEILRANPDVIVMDYRLDLEHSEYVDNDYRASLLAQSIRGKALDEKKKDVPIILVSSEKNIKYFRPDKTAYDLFDKCYLRERLNEDRDRNNIIEKVISLAEGYKKILKNMGDESPTSSNAVEDILSLAEDENYVLEGTNISDDIAEAQAPHVISRIILTRLIKPTGILLGPKDIIARLAIDVSDDNEGERKIYSLLKEKGCQYQGVFSNGWMRFWSHQFEAWAEDIFGRPVTSISGSKRVEKLNAVFGHKFKPFQSSWNNSSDELFAFKCTCCHRPTEMRHSVLARDSSSLRYTERKRICYDCVQTGRHEEAPYSISISSEDLILAKKVMDMKREGVK